MSYTYSKHYKEYRRDPIDDTFVPCTAAQRSYIEILRTELCYDLNTRNRMIQDILKMPSDKPGFTFDIYTLSKSDASSVITQFLLWKEQRQHGRTNA